MITEQHINLITQVENQQIKPDLEDYCTDNEIQTIRSASEWHIWTGNSSSFKPPNQFRWDINTDIK